MRLKMLSAVAFTLVTLLGINAAMAQSNAPGGQNFGRVYCAPHVVCPGDTGFSPAALPANANSCANQYFGGSQATKFFDDMAMLDSGNCLPTRPEGVMTSNGVSLAPQCCLIQLSDHLCGFRCELNKI